MATRRASLVSCKSVSMKATPCAMALRNAASVFSGAWPLAPRWAIKSMGLQHQRTWDSAPVAMLASGGKIAGSGVLETAVAVNGGEGAHPLPKFGGSNGRG